MSRKTLVKTLAMVLVATLLLSVQVFATEVTITGTINDMYQIVTDTGDVYEVADNDLASEVLEYVGQTLKITGTLVEDDSDVKTILVNEYKVIQKD